MKIILSLILFTGCAGYIDKMHHDFDQGETYSNHKEKKHDKFALYRKHAGGQGSATNKSLPPSVKRDYKPEEQVKKRYTSNDLVDKDNSASLWSGEGKDSYLFTTDQRKRNGDIVIINVMGKLKDEITAELKRAFPEKIALSPKDDDSGKKTKSEKKPEAKAIPNPEDAVSNPSTVYDKISGIIIEEISSNHVLISGRKTLLFRNKKHLIEIQALVNRKNIGFDENVNSDDVLENNVSVMR